MKKAFVMRNKPGKVDRISETLNENEIIIGWSNTEDKLLSNDLLREEFKVIIRSAYSDKYKDNPQSLGYATGCMWRFINEIEKGDLVVIPANKSFYVCKVLEDDVLYDSSKIDEDTAIRRKVKFLNSGITISKKYADAALKSRLKYRGTIVNATDILDSIETAIKNSKEGKKPDFKNDTNTDIVEMVYNRLKSSKSILDPNLFEELIKDMLSAMGAISRIPAKNAFKGRADCDIIADFEDLGISIYIQVKYHTSNSETDEWAVIQISEAMKQLDEINNTNSIGWVISAGVFSERSKSMADESNIRVIEGEELAEMLVKSGVLNK